MNGFTRAAIAASLVAAAACGGGSYSPASPSTPPAPGATTPVPSGATTIAIVGSSGSQAYNPNPVQVSAGGQIVWVNHDSVTHHIVMDDGSGDAGTVAPGATSAAIALKGSSGSYHCTIHPSMVGSINGQAPPPTTCPNGYCG